MYEHTLIMIVKISDVLFNFEIFILQVNNFLKSHFEVRYDKIQAISIYNEHRLSKDEFVRIIATSKYHEFAINVHAIRKYTDANIDWGRLSRGRSRIGDVKDFCYVISINGCNITYIDDLIQVFPSLYELDTDIFDHEQYNPYLYPLEDYQTFPSIHPYEEYNETTVLGNDMPYNLFTIQSFRDVYVDPLYKSDQDNEFENESYDIVVFTITKNIYIQDVGVYYHLSKVSDTCQLCYTPTDHLSVRTKCNHSFHLACLDTWMVKTRSCPYCASNEVHIPRYRAYDTTDQTCAICMERMVTIKSAIALLCDHAFHSDCIFPWISSHGKCPLCRRQV